MSVDHRRCSRMIGKSQGKGIFLFQKLSQISEWRNDYRWKPDNPQAENYIVQEYISKPLLVGGKKFDLRIFVLVTSFSPLTVYLYRSGFARFSSSQYSADAQHFGNDYIHLTNFAVQKSAPHYCQATGAKWDLRQLKLYLMGKYGPETVNRVFYDMQLCIIRSLLSVQKVMINDKHCFELYGYDVLIDENMKVWLLEANASPSLSGSSPEDYAMKFSLVDDCLAIVDMEDKLKGDEQQVGGFDLVYRNGLVKFDSHCQFTTYLGCHNPSLASAMLRKRASKESE
eukprot:796242_1